jgi:stalled ribosome rescue protein Dom34
MAYSHAVVWIDHDKAHVIHFGIDTAEEKTVHASKRDGNLHHKRGSIGSGHPPVDRAYYHDVALAMQGAAEILVAGPANAKQELMNHLKEHDKAVAACVVGVEPLDHPSDGQLLAFARKYFGGVYGMRPQL